ncbi:sensor histidine kinase [Deinococcus sp. VB343]|uniref:sensor histidine kinase n=1 Tax=Deinococcus sp. VB343 TaxID=3385567 RepID=UPI0039C8CAFE
MTHLAGEVVDSFQVKALERGLRLELRLGQTCQVTADPDRLRQILSNLLENALRHAEAQVVVGLDTVGGQVYLSVDDDGAGIPVEKGEQVFTRFTRLDESRSRDAGGSGLGLAIVQALAQAHGGTAKAHDSELGGTRMLVALPLSALST